MTDVTFAELLKQAKSANQPMVGEFLFQCIATEPRLSGKGFQQIKGDFRCVGGAFAGRTVSNYFTLNTDSMDSVEMFFAALKAFGFTDSMLAQLGNVDAQATARIAGQMLNKNVMIKCAAGEFNGRAKTECKGFKLPAGGAAAVAASPGGALPQPVAAQPVAAQPAQPQYAQPQAAAPQQFQQPQVQQPMAVPQYAQPVAPQQPQAPAGPAMPVPAAPQQYVPQNGAHPQQQFAQAMPAPAAPQQFAQAMPQPAAAAPVNGQELAPVPPAPAPNPATAVDNPPF